MPEIKLTHITKRYGGFYAVDDLSLDIEDNAFITLLGPSGCGKTTTLRMIAGLETPTSGQIKIGDRVVFDSEKGINIPPNKRKVGFLFQNYALWPNMTVYQNIAFGLSNVIKDGKHLTKAEIDARVKRVSSLVKIEMFMNRYPAELSGGQQQRVAIARTLAPEPQVLFMDEPLSNLDAKLRLEMRYELQRLHLETGSTFVYVTHDQMEAMTLATRICLINNGVLQQYAAPLTVYSRPSNLFVADFVGNPSMNFVEAAGAQAADGTIPLTLLGDHKAVFKPSEPIDMNKWFADRDSQAAAEEEDLEVKRKDKKYVEKANKDESFHYHVSLVDDRKAQTDKDHVITNEDFVIGIRPEFLSFDEKEGGIEGEIYGVMPTGMESTIKIAAGNFLLTGVVFGSKLYQIGTRQNITVHGDNILLFDRKSGKCITSGRLTLG